MTPGFVAVISELMFLETSALTGENVEEAFVQCARKILNKIESGKRHSINNLPRCSSLCSVVSRQCFQEEVVRAHSVYTRHHGFGGFVRVPRAKPAHPSHGRFQGPTD